MKRRKIRKVQVTKPDGNARILVNPFVLIPCTILFGLAILLGPSSLSRGLVGEAETRKQVEDSLTEARDLFANHQNLPVLEDLSAIANPHKRKALEFIKKKDLVRAIELCQAVIDGSSKGADSARARLIMACSFAALLGPSGEELYREQISLAFEDDEKAAVTAVHGEMRAMFAQDQIHRNRINKIEFELANSRLVKQMIGEDLQRFQKDKTAYEFDASFGQANITIDQIEKVFTDIENATFTK